MQYLDRLYGPIAIDVPIVRELVYTPAFQRLKEINQYGGVNFVYPDRYQVSRFEHSLGVWHVLRTLGARLDVQLAGLLHDLGHTAFSHMVDQATDSREENFHEQYVNRIPGIAEIGEILARERIRLKPIDQYSEIKVPMPGIGADRFDYALRDYVAGTNARAEFGLQALADLSIRNGRLVFRSLPVAAEFAELGLQAMWEVIYAPHVAAVYQALIDMLRVGMREKFIGIDELFTTDRAVLDLLLKRAERFPKYCSQIFSRKFEVVPGTAKEFDFKHIKAKVRIFDPDIWVDGTIRTLSEISADFRDRKAAMQTRFEHRQKGEFFKIIFV